MRARAVDQGEQHRSRAEPHARHVNYVQRSASCCGIRNHLLHSGDSARVLDQPGPANVHEHRGVVPRRDAKRVQNFLACRRRRVVDPHADTERAIVQPCVEPLL